MLKRTIIEDFNRTITPTKLTHNKLKQCTKSNEAHNVRHVRKVKWVLPGALEGVFPYKDIMSIYKLSGFNMAAEVSCEILS